MYKVTKNAATGKMTGSPILYYRANKLKTAHDVASAAADSCTYNVYDSIGGVMFQGLAGAIPSLVGGNHHMPGDLAWFYNAIANPNFTTPHRPYRAESFILHSAGPDGLYGTTDDIFNFETEK